MALSNPLVAVERYTSIVTDNGTGSVMTLRMSEFVEELTRIVNRNTALSGIGSPEGVVEAQLCQLYLDISGTSGEVLYVKQSGSGATGWVLV